MEITKESHDLEKTITGGNISPLIETNGNLKPEFNAVINRLLTSTHKMDTLPNLSKFVKSVHCDVTFKSLFTFHFPMCSEVVPEYDTSVFKIASFREKQRRGDEVYSDPMEVQGLVWRLKVYPVS